MAIEMEVQHRVYFMDKKLYNIVEDPIINEEPFNKLAKEDWLKILHHLNAHEIEVAQGTSIPLVPRGRLLHHLESNIRRLFFYSLIDDYFSQNNVADSSYGGQPEDFFSTLLPFREHHLYEKALGLWNEFKDYELVYVGKKEGFDIQKRKAS